MAAHGLEWTIGEVSTLLRAVLVKHTPVFLDFLLHIFSLTGTETLRRERVLIRDSLVLRCGDRVTARDREELMLTL